MVIEDEHGERWVVDEGGRVSNGGSDDSSSTPDTVASQDSIDFIVEFVASENQTYGFDAKRDNVGQYEMVDIGGEQYAVPWKSVETGRLDATLATTEKSAFPESVGFKSINGELPSRPASGADQKQLSVTGRVNDTVEGITAYVIVEEDEGEEEVLVGKLNVASYDKIQRHLVVVPVFDSGAPNAATLATEINHIYGQAVAEWEVIVAQPFEPEDDIVGLDDGESGILAAFPPAMQRFNREYKRSISNYDRDAYYVFLIKGSGSSRKGFMPFKRQFGYIFADNLGSTPTATAIAHELGHGAFRLAHPLSEFGLPLPDNLMHNANGKQLRKYQWDFIHDPQAVNSWLADDVETSLEEEALSDYGFIEFLRSLSIDVSDISLEVLQQMYAAWQAFKTDVQLASAQVISVAYKNKLITLESVHIALDVVGFVPVIGEVADGLNGIIYVAEGDYLNATFSGIALAPVAGDAVGKGLKYTLKAIENSSSAGKAVTEALRKNTSGSTY